MPRRWGCGDCRAAAHMGAALQKNLQNMRRGGGSAPPIHERRIFTKMSFRGAQRRGNPFPRVVKVRRKGEYGCPCCGAQNFRAALRRPLKILTAATRSSRFFCHRQRSIRSPHRRARRFAMTFFEGAAGNGGSSGTPTPTDARFAYVGQKTNTAPTAAKDDALHRDTTLLRRPLTRNGLTECRYTPALSRAPPFGSEAALRPSTRRLRSHVPPSVPRPLSPARALFGGLK